MIRLKLELIFVDNNIHKTIGGGCAIINRQYDITIQGNGYNKIIDLNKINYSFIIY